MYLHASAKTWLFTIFLCLEAAATLGQGKNFFIDRKEPSWIVKVSPKTYKVNQKDVSDGYYMGLVEKQNHAELKEEYRHFIREIISQSGVQNGSEISVTYDPGFQQLIFHKIIVWRNNHPVDQLSARKFKVLQNEKELSKFIYSGTFDAYLILDDVRKGDRIEYAYTIKGRNPIFGAKYANTFYFEGSSSYGREYTNLIVSKKRHLNFKSFNFDTKPLSRDVGGLRIYEWESTLTKTHRAEAYEPSWYVAEKYTQVSEYQSWIDVVNWGLKVNSYPDLKTPLVDKTVRELQSLSRNDPEKYIELATRFVQDEIRYMGIEMGEYSQRPNSPERILIQRYGDCKDKSLLLIYLLNKQNIDAYMAYVDTYSGKRTRDFLPSPFLFDHAVVVVEYKNNKTWIDPTISNQRGTFQTIYFPNYGQALVLKAGVDQPEDVISIPTGKLVADLTFNIPDTAAGNKASLTISSTYTDNYADDIRLTIDEQGTDGLEKSFREYISKYYPDIESKGNIIIKDNESSNTINIIESYLIGNIWLKSDKANTNRYIYFYGDLIDVELRTVKDKNRKSPLSLKYPINVEENIFVQLPDFWRYKDQFTKVESDNYYFEFSRFSKANTLKINYSYRNFKDHINASDIGQYIKDSRKIGDNLSTYIEYRPMAKNVNYNPYLLVLATLTILASGFYFLKKYHNRTPYDIQQIMLAPPIGGWLIVAAIFVLLDPLSLLFSAASTNLLSWSTETTQTGTIQTLLISSQVVKIVCFSIQLSWSILISALFFKRRDNLPRQYVKYLHFEIFLFLFYLAIDLLSGFATDQTTVQVTQVFGNLFAVAVCLSWAIYFRRSARVKKTFVFTYPELRWRMDQIKHTNGLVTGTLEKEKEASEL
jgi:transglutaminase-like putative cysteine protease